MAIRYDAGPHAVPIPASDLLFTGRGARILVLLNCRDAAAAMRNFEHQITRHNPLGTTVLGRGR